jgi:prevent-host-death family protein
MVKTISVSEAKNQLSAMLDWAVENQAEVIIASHGQPKAVILSYGEYETIVEQREKTRRRLALEKMEALAAIIQERNQDLSAGEAEQIADEISRDAVDRLVKKGKVSFEQP